MVEVSLEDATGGRCVDLVRTGGDWSWVECRRDPEDAHGWRRLHPSRAGFANRGLAQAGAAASVRWLAAAERVP